MNSDQIFTELRKAGDTLLENTGVIKTKIVLKQLSNK